jgi:hypothetical protein
MSTLARATDPLSSHIAGQDASAFAANHRAEIIKLVVQHPGKTAAELAQLCDLDRYQIGRRLKEIEHSGKIRRGIIRTCTVGRKVATTWFPLTVF